MTQPGVRRRAHRLTAATGLTTAVVLVLSACSAADKSDVAAGRGSGGATSGATSGASARPTGTATNAAAKPQAAAFNAATVGIVNASTRSGGNLNLLASGDCDSWDPANTYYNWCWNMQRLFTRTLVGFGSVAGVGNSALTGDLATGLGEHNSDFTRWTYRLKDVKWENGQTVTSKEVKYGLERVFATDLFSNGPASYYLCVLAKCDASGNPSYSGPYRNRGGGLDGISTPDDKTIVFKLQTSTPRFDYLMALPAAAPVPLDENGVYRGAKYTLHPLSTGPYQFSAYTPEQKVVWVRNKQWDKSTDTIRTPLADKITLTINGDAADNDAALRAGTADAIADGGVAGAFRTSITSTPALRNNADNPVSSYTRYFAVFPQVAPLDNVHCRRAVAYALNKAALQEARGGPFAAEIAHTMSHPTTPGHDSTADPYPSGSNDTGDLTKARDELKQCGQPDGFTTKQAYVNSGTGPAVFTASQTALARVGITIAPAVHAQLSYYGGYLGRPATVKSVGIGLAQAGWGADYPSGDSYWTSIAAGTSPPGGGNYTQLNDATVNDLLKRAAGTATPDEALFTQVDARVMSDAVMLPFVFDKTLHYRNARLTNVRTNFALGAYYDFVNIGVNDGK